MFFCFILLYETQLRALCQHIFTFSSLRVLGNWGRASKKRNVEIGRGPAVRRVLLMAVTEVLRGTADRTASGARETLLLPQEAPRRRATPPSRYRQPEPRTPARQTAGAALQAPPREPQRRLA